MSYFHGFRSSLFFGFLALCALFSLLSLCQSMESDSLEPGGLRILRSSGVVGVSGWSKGACFALLDVLEEVARMLRGDFGIALDVVGDLDGGDLFDEVGVVVFELDGVGVVLGGMTTDFGVVLVTVDFRLCVTFDLTLGSADEEFAADGPTSAISLWVAGTKAAPLCSAEPFGSLGVVTGVDFGDLDVFGVTFALDESVGVVKLDGLAFGVTFLTGTATTADFTVGVLILAGVFGAGTLNMASSSLLVPGVNVLLGASGLLVFLSGFDVTTSPGSLEILMDGNFGRFAVDTEDFDEKGIGGITLRGLLVAFFTSSGLTGVR